MRIPLAISLLVSSSVLFQPAQTSDLGAFPTPSAGMTIPAYEADGWTMEQLLGEYARLTDQRLMIREDTRALLKQARVPLGEALTIAPETLHAVVETILIESDFVLSIAREANPRILSVSSMQNAARSNVRERACFVPADQLEAWRDHPAILVTTVLTLDSVDVRVLTNSMRAMLTDANTQQLIPVGNTHSLLLTGFAPQVADLVEMLREVNEDARAANAAMSGSAEQDS